MERRRNVDTQKTLTSEVGVEEVKANQARPAARVERQAAVEKQAQVQHALKAVYRSPEVRAGKIEALRAQIEAGTYRINRTSLAMKLLGMTEQDAG
jgi:flagellar biosynthesis anti-sigma factor FlgM